MRRVLLALLMCSVALTGAGCGMGGSSSSASGAPEPSDLARQAFRAARDAGSVRFTLDASVTADGQPPMKLSVSGVFGKERLKADVSFTGQGQSLSGSVLVDETAFFLRFLDRWYGKTFPPAQKQELEQSFATEDAFGAKFDDVFDGRLSDGPLTDGVPTWAYNGSLDVDRLLELMAEEGSVDDESREQVKALAENTRFTLLVGKADSLPRAFLLDLKGEGIDFTGLAAQAEGSIRITVRGSFTGWGEPVTITRPQSYAPLEELIGQFLGL